MRGYSEMKERVDFLEEDLRLMPITDNGLTTTTYNDPPVFLLRMNLILPGLAVPEAPSCRRSAQLLCCDLQRAAFAN